MVANTDIKFYVHTNNNAPQLQNAYGSMIQVLDACLVNGIQIGTVSSLTANGTTVTATFSTAHNLMQYQVIQIAGAIQAEYNGQHRILSVLSSTTVTFALAAAPTASPATGTISASLPPLGWEKPFGSANANGGGKAAYRSTNLLLPSRPFLRVVDELDPVWTSTYAKYAKVGIVEDMSDIDTLLGVQAPFDPASPNKNWNGTGTGSSAINGWAKWYYSRSNSEYIRYNGTNDSYPTSDGNQTFLVVGNQDYFYFMPSVVAGNKDAVSIYGFGAFYSYFPSDNCNNFLAASNVYNTAANISERVCNYGSLSSNYNNSLLLQRGLGDFNYALAKTSSEAFPNYSVDSLWLSGYGNVAGEPSKTGIAFSLPIKIFQGNILRGRLNSVNFIPHSKPYNNLQSILSGNKMIISKDLMVYAVGSGTLYFGQVTFDLGDL